MAEMRFMGEGILDEGLSYPMSDSAFCSAELGFLSWSSNFCTFTPLGGLRGELTWVPDFCNFLFIVYFLALLLCSRLILPFLLT